MADPIVVVDEPVKPGTINPNDPLKGFTGCTLLFQSAPGATPEVRGLVIACPNVPNWMSSEFSNAFEEHQNRTIDLTHYATDWLEKLIYLDKADLDLTKADMLNFTWAPRLAHFGPAFDNQLSDGCARVSPRVPVFKVAFTNGVATNLAFENTYNAAVSGRDPDNLPRASAITIAPLDARSGFEKTQMHTDAMDDSAKLRKITDPDGARRNKRMATVLAAYAHLTRP